MMHHPNMHHQAMSGHPPQHLGGHQGMPGHHQLPPHQMHRENRHVTMARVAMGPSQGGGGMGGPGAHGQIGGMGGMGLPHHGPGPRPPHPVRPMHHPPAQHHSVPPGMKPMRRPYGMGGGYPAGGPGVVFTPPMQPPAQPPAHLVTHHGVTPTSSSKPAASSPAAGSEAAEGGEARGPAEAAGPAPAPAAAPLANSKEKTPMCLVNELARFNKIKHQYRLTSETGPAHKKVFTVTLRLGDTEEYTAEGSSIKRAQHAAAGAALAQTQFPAPPPRAPPAHAPPGAHHRHAGTVMPTVELNALAMKLCQPAVYTSVPPLATPPRFPRGRAPPPPPPPPPAPYRLPGPFAPYTHRLLAPGLTYRVRVSVGGRVWMGEGPTPQAARHDAAARALQDLRPPPDAGPPAPAPPDGEAKLAEGSAGADAAAELGSEVKSPVSLVHELALKRNLSVIFTVKSERGPPHMRVFITTCTVGDMETEGEGNGKKVSKRRAAELMLAEVRRRWPPALLRPRAPQPPKRKQQPAKKKPRNLIKESGSPAAERAGGAGEAADNPISRLAMARHAARARSPQYRVLEERGASRKREFLVQCDAPPHRATGLGPNKKAAKRRAAYNVLVAMDLIPADGDGSLPSNGDPVSPTASDASKLSGSDSKRKEGEAAGAAAEARQPVPGVLMMDYHQRGPARANGVSEGAAAAAAAAGASPNSPGAKDQLMYLSQLLGFTVQFSDFPKRNHGEYLSLVSLSTEPPVMCHGGGASTAQSHEQCARAALRALALMGLDAPGTPTLASSSPAAAPLSNGLAE